MLFMNRVLKRTCWLLLSAVLVPFAPAQFVNFEGKQTAPIRLSPDGTGIGTARNRVRARLPVPV